MAGRKLFVFLLFSWAASGYLAGCGSPPDEDGPDPVDKPEWSPVVQVDPSLDGMVGQPVELDGSASSDPQGLPLSYQWKQVSGPPVTLEDARSSVAKFKAIESGDYRFELLVTNGVEAATATVVVNVQADPPPSPTPEPTLTPTPNPTVLTTASPTFDPPDGTRVTPGGLDVSLACSTDGAEIRYTLDGSEPSASSGETYTHVIQVAGATTIKAMAHKPGLIDSEVVSAHFVWDESAAGNLRWKFVTGGCILSSPAIGADGTVYVGSDDGRFYAVNSDGTKKWEFAGGGSFRSSPALAEDGTIYVGCDDGRLYAINANGTKKWEFAAGSAFGLSPALGSEGTVYAACDNGMLYALNPDGTAAWEFTRGLSVGSSPVVDVEGTIYIGFWDGLFCAVHSDGTLKWEVPIDGEIASSPAMGADGTLYIGTLAGKLIAMNPDGSKRREFLLASPVCSSPAVTADGAIVVGTLAGKIFAVNSDGTARWEFASMGSTYSSPAVAADGTIYIGSDDDMLHAVNADGTSRWTFATGGDVCSSPAIGPDGTVYAGSLDGILYAVRGSAPLVESPWPKSRRDLVNSGYRGTGVWFTLATAVDGQGAILLEPPGGRYHPHQRVTLTAQPGIGWTFDHWEECLTSAANPDIIRVTTNQTVKGVFRSLMAPQIQMETSKGTIVIELDREKAPVTVDNFLKYANEGFYDGKDGKGATLFHRVIPGFMVQGGGFNDKGVQKNTHAPIANEASNGLKNLRGTLAMARTNDPNSATAQFFVNLVDNTHLDYAAGQNPGYAVFGKVVQGMDVVDAIAGVATKALGPFKNYPADPIYITAVTAAPGK